MLILQSSKISSRLQGEWRVFSPDTMSSWETELKCGDFYSSITKKVLLFVASQLNELLSA